MRTLSCDEVVERLPALIVGDLDQNTLQEIESHSATCRCCANELADSRTLSRTLASVAQARHLQRHIAATLPGLRERLMAALPPTAAYDYVDSPIGPLLLVVSSEGLCGLHFGGSEKELAAWGEQSPFALQRDPEAIRPYRDQLAQYFAGERRDFDLPLDLSATTPFAREVLSATARVSFGQLATYQTIAKAIGKPGATRAVGNALGSNPVAIVVPCHRVIRSNGSLGGYTGGLDIKRHLLELEGVLLFG